MENKIKVSCPDCRHEFFIDIDEVLTVNLEKDIKTKLDLEYQKKLKRFESIEEEKNEMVKKLANAKEDALLDAKKSLLEKESKIKAEAEAMAMKKAELAMMEKESAIKKKMEEMNIAMTQKVVEAERKVRTDEQMKAAELQAKLQQQEN